MDAKDSPTPITDFLFRLEVDPELVKWFVEDPDAAVEGAGLPDEAAEALKRRDLLMLQGLVDAEHAGQVQLLIRGWIKGWIKAPS